MRTPLPIDDVMPELRETLAGARNCVLEAPPGAGKTTRAPLGLLDAAWLNGKKILMLEPRRVAARMAAARMAQELGESAGDTVGYRVRLDSKVGPRTRIEVLTEGLLTRRLQSDPELRDVGLVIFDEFHERSLNADLGLALAVETQSALNEDLRILVMSATLDGAKVAATLGGAPVVRAQGRMYPVETIYAPPVKPIAQAMADAIGRALRLGEGGILAFLPGEGEIRRVQRELEARPDAGGLAIMPLYGALPAAAQDMAVAPLRDGRRKIVLATAIAETSLTIEDVRIVVDSGLQRLAAYDPATGFTRLVTQTVSLASADQRRGRAGRVGPGLCVRLWAEAQTRALRPYTPPEILTSDLAPFVLELAQWGVQSADGLALMDRPPPSAWSEARETLMRLEALDRDGRIAPHGREILRFGAHPRLAHMMIRAAGKSWGATAAAVAAILAERDVLKTMQGRRDVDLRTRLEFFAHGGMAEGADRAGLARAKEQAGVWRRQLGARADELEAGLAGPLIALAFPERVAQRRGAGSFRLASGRGAAMEATDALAKSEFLAVAALDGADANAKVHLAAPLSLAEIEDLFPNAIEQRDAAGWDSKEQAVVARSERRLGALILQSRPLTGVPQERLVEGAIQGLRELGLQALDWTPAAQSLRTRIEFVRRIDPEGGWPDMSDNALETGLETWLGPFLGGVTRRAHFAKVDVREALAAMLDWGARKKLDALAPETILVPSGSNIAVDYGPEGPVLAVRLQELFGLAETPRVGGGTVPVTLHLLSPARRPVQVTKDLKSFWTTGYPEVKKDLKGRYPKHFWPDDPWTATATARAKPRPV
jgi:ATP-dependent helicase HrpB